MQANRRPGTPLNLPYYTLFHSHRNPCLCENKRANSTLAVLWTGGKDSALALYDAVQAGCEVKSLVTFAPTGGNFRAHPLDFIAYQAQAMGISHYVMRIKEPYKQSYEDAIRSLRMNNGIELLVTGDISEVDGYPNWIKECCEPSGMQVYFPLWHVERTALLKRLIANGFKTIFSCVKAPWFKEDWAGRPLDIQALELMVEKAAATGLDMCGENGEYHTLILDGPPFIKSIQIQRGSVCKDGAFMFFNIHGLMLRDK